MSEPEPRQSAIYEGWVRHRRRAAPAHDFVYRVNMVYLDLAELPQALDGSWLWSARRPALSWYRRADYGYRADLDLADEQRELVQEKLGFRPAGPVRMLTMLRSYGISFNPVSFYYLYGEGGEAAELQAIIAEITNTPWLERFSYVLDAREQRGGSLRFSMPKIFHVSPFFDMDLHYEWRFSRPGERLAVHMTSYRSQDSGERPIFESTLSLHRQPLNPGTMRRALWRVPFATARAVAAIYGHALLLRLRGAKFFVHPRKRALTAKDSP